MLKLFRKSPEIDFELRKIENELFSKGIRILVIDSGCNRQCIEDLEYSSIDVVFIPEAKKPEAVRKSVSQFFPKFVLYSGLDPALLSALIDLNIEIIWNLKEYSRGDLLPVVADKSKRSVTQSVVGRIQHILMAQEESQEWLSAHFGISAPLLDLNEVIASEQALDVLAVVSGNKENLGSERDFIDSIAGVLEQNIDVAVVHGNSTPYRTERSNMVFSKGVIMEGRSYDRVYVSRFAGSILPPVTSPVVFPMYRPPVTRESADAGIKQCIEGEFDLVRVSSEVSTDSGGNSEPKGRAEVASHGLPERSFCQKANMTILDRFVVTPELLVSMIRGRVAEGDNDRAESLLQVARLRFPENDLFRHFEISLAE